MKSDLYAKMASHRVYTIKQQKSTRPLNFTPIIYNNNNQSFRLTISIVKLTHPLFSFVSFFLSFPFEIELSPIRTMSQSEFFYPLVICQFSKLFSMWNRRKWYVREGKIVVEKRRARGKAGIHGALSSRRCNSSARLPRIRNDLCSEKARLQPLKESQPHRQGRFHRCNRDNSSGKVNSINSIGFLLSDRKSCDSQIAIPENRKFYVSDY